MRRTKTTMWNLGAVLVTLAACGGGGGSGGTGGTGDDGATGPTSTGDAQGGPYQPLVVGATWTYDTVDQGVTATKTASIEAFEDVGGARAGTMTYRWQEVTPDGKQLTWYQLAGDGIGRIREQSFDAAGAMKSEHWYDPFLLRVDESSEHLRAGASWSTTFNETVTSAKHDGTTTTVTVDFTVQSLTESVTVPAGTFTCLRLLRHDRSSGNDKTYWFARGVGKVKESNSKGGETLRSYLVP